MPSKRITAIIGGRETVINLEVPGRHFTDSDKSYSTRVTQYIEARMRGMGVAQWQEDFATDAANRDNTALQTLLRARRGDGQTGLTDLLSSRRPRRQKHQKYPRTR
ncbi:MAG: hypothetical protein ACOY3M_01945 [Patescibacteria group bacterium]